MVLCMTADLYDSGGRDPFLKVIPVRERQEKGFEEWRKIRQLNS